ncbi:uncharacterized protein LOC108106320 [Drosophila eugracilis]|uniref:uncharacterized protein LOC108106320 n=1 Tax=Drosophila eugracilis TaxID=29029 RepID=UPI0007E61AC9|nr:uncharacterized protein LOC108106320 [Drosophila eugracilis]
MSKPSKLYQWFRLRNMSETNNVISPDESASREEGGTPMASIAESNGGTLEMNEAPPILMEVDQEPEVRTELNNNISSESHLNLRKSKIGRVRKPKKTQADPLVITCRRCSTSLMILPESTKFFTCAEVNGRLFKVNEVSAKTVLAAKKPKKRPSPTGKNSKQV